MNKPKHDGTVRVKKTRGSWVSAPLDIITHPKLSSSAKVVLIFMLALSERENWVIKVPHIRHELSLGDSAWRAARANLIDNGYFRLQRIHDTGGRYTWSSEVSDVPEFTSRNVAIRGFPTDGFSTRGKPTDDKATTSTTSTKKQKQHARSRVPAPADAGDAAAESVTKGKENKTFSIVHGIGCWTPQDVQTAEELVQQHGREAVLDVVGAMHALGIAPLPGRVAKELQQRVAATRASQERAVAEARMERIDEASRQRALRDMEAMMALQANQEPKGRDP